MVKYLHPTQSFNVELIIQDEELSEDKTYTFGEKRKQYPNAYKPWNVEDDEQLITLYKTNKGIKELMDIFKRNEGAIRSRIKKLMYKSNGEQ